MILYIQTTAIPRSEIHNTGVIQALNIIDKCEHFSEIRWFINIDVAKSSDWKFEDYNITSENFKKCVSNLNKTKISINVSEEPCFYLAFRRLTLDIQNDIKKEKIGIDDYCIMWFEDDWFIQDESGFNDIMNIFLNDNRILVAPMVHNKINMGGNPDIIKGRVFDFFKNVNFDKDNKRDPESIRKNEVFEPYIWIDPYPEWKVSLHEKLIKINPEAKDKVIEASWWNQDVNPYHYTEAHKVNYRILSSSVVEDVGDAWKIGKIRKSWNQKEKEGIDSSRSYTYK